MLKEQSLTLKDQFRVPRWMIKVKYSSPIDAMTAE